MKILHLFSNSRWTGPAEPALNLCVALRRAGIEADFACPPGARGPVYTLVETARDHGIEPIHKLYLSKYAHPLKNLVDAVALKRLLRENGYDAVHCHLDNDHRIAVGAAGGLGVPVVRSSYCGLGFQHVARHRRLLAGTTHLIEPSHMALEHDAATYGFPRERMTVVPGAMDVGRFDPAREVPDGRRWLGIRPDAFVVGIVARMQRHRHYEDFFEAIRRLGDVHAIVVGRGTYQEEVGREPVRRLGIEARVHFVGHVQGENYVGVLKAFDAIVFLVPGSDGTCRAVREGMAMGKPAVVAARGMLHEIVEDGKEGFVVDGSVEALSEALQRLAANRALTRRLGHAAREKAATRYSLEAQAREVLGVYGASVTLGRRSPTARS